MKYVFLDIDGVLNGHEFCRESECCLINPGPVKWLNKIIAEIGPKFIISSSWRYMIHGGAMSVLGFEYMLRTHGVSKDFLIHGITCKDEDLPLGDRSYQIVQYIYKSEIPVNDYLIIDDLDLGFSKNKLNFFQTHGEIGLREEDVPLILAWLS